MRALPLQRSVKEKKKRADCHLWPKGTFIEVNGGGSRKVAKIIQRRQQCHDPSEWKGSSYPVSCKLALSESYPVKRCHPGVACMLTADYFFLVAGPDRRLC